VASFSFQHISAQPTSTSKSHLFQVWTTVFSGWFGVGAWRREFGAMFTSASPKIWYMVYGISQFMAVLMGKMAENGDQPFDFGVFVPGKVSYWRCRWAMHADAKLRLSQRSAKACPLQLTFLVILKSEHQPVSISLQLDLCWTVLYRC